MNNFSVNCLNTKINKKEAESGPIKPTQSYKNINLLFPTTFIAAFNLSTWSGQDSNPLPYDHIQDDRFNHYPAQKKP